MKLTRRGKDYLKAVILATAIAAVTAPPIILALGFSMAVVAAASLVIVRTTLISTARLEPQRLRAFKGEKASAKLSLGGAGLRWVGSTEISIVTPDGVSCALGELKQGSSDVVLESSYAGLFSELSVSAKVSDLLGLFSRDSVVPLQDFSLESLPLSLRLPTHGVFISPLTSGDAPAGRRGGGQELYAIEQYRTGLDSKDVLWKRVAGSPTEEMTSRVREANVKGRATAAVVLSWDSEHQRTAQVDLVSEALGQLGRLLFETGSSLEVLYFRDGSWMSAGASTLGTLADAILEVSTVGNSTGISAHGMPQCDLVVVGLRLHDNLSGFIGTTDQPLLVLSDEPEAPKLSRRHFVFTGRENLSKLVSWVLEK